MFAAPVASYSQIVSLDCAGITADIWSGSGKTGSGCQQMPASTPCADKRRERLVTFTRCHKLRSSALQMLTEAPSGGPRARAGIGLHWLVARRRMVARWSIVTWLKSPGDLTALLLMPPLPTVAGHSAAEQFCENA